MARKYIINSKRKYKIKIWRAITLRKRSEKCSISFKSVYALLKQTDHHEMCRRYIIFRIRLGENETPIVNIVDALLRKYHQRHKRSQHEERNERAKRRRENNDEFPMPADVLIKAIIPYLSRHVDRISVVRTNQRYRNRQKLGCVITIINEIRKEVPRLEACAARNSEGNPRSCESAVSSKAYSISKAWQLSFLT